MSTDPKDPNYLGKRSHRDAIDQINPGAPVRGEPTRVITEPLRPEDIQFLERLIAESKRTDASQATPVAAEPYTPAPDDLYTPAELAAIDAAQQRGDNVALKKIIDGARRRMVEATRTATRAIATLNARAGGDTGPAQASQIAAETAPATKTDAAVDKFAAQQKAREAERLKANRAGQAREKAAQAKANERLKREEK